MGVVYYIIKVGVKIKFVIFDLMGFEKVEKEYFGFVGVDGMLLDFNSIFNLNFKNFMIIFYGLLVEIFYSFVV